jgi:hypothetical protein
MRYTRIHYEGRDIYLEEPLRSQDLHPARVKVLEDGLGPDELPDDADPICADDLPRDAWADYVDPDERGDFERDQQKDRSAKPQTPRSPMNENKCLAPCPLCGSPAAAYPAVGTFGYVAHCSGCYDCNPSRWARLRGTGGTAELATEEWLEQAREYAASTEIPPLPCPYTPVDFFAELARQVSEETDRQRVARIAALSVTTTALRRWKPGHTGDTTDAGAIGDGA